MPDKEFLETYPLFRAYRGRFTTYEQIPTPALHMHCEEDRSDQTFNMQGTFTALFSAAPAAFVRPGVVLARYRCASCKSFDRHFALRFAFGPGGEKEAYPVARVVTKVGQYPAWSIKGDPNVERLLGDHSEYLKRGMICESQGYGIGAFAYYRRIVEETIDSLLGEVADIIPEEERENYLAALEKVKSTRVTADKIEAIKDLLPPILRPNNTNPLKALHETLSEGIHAATDERCLELAAAVREVMVFLADQVAASRSAGKRFSESMRKLLEKRVPPAAPA